MTCKTISSFRIFFACIFGGLTLSAVDPKPAAEPVKKEMTFSMIKPTAVKEGHIGGIIEVIEKSRLHIAGLKMVKLSKEEAENFYAEHKGKPFYGELVNMMSSGPIVAMVIEGENVVTRLRDIVGATDPKKANRGTIRQLFGKNVGENAIHASDSPASAITEIPFFFTTQEIYP